LARDAEKPVGKAFLWDHVFRTGPIAWSIRGGTDGYRSHTERIRLGTLVTPLPGAALETGP